MPVTMKKFHAIEESLKSLIPEFTICGNLMFLTPLKPILRGLYFDRTSSKEHFRVHSFVLPLFVPTRIFYFNYGHHLKPQSNKGINWYFSSYTLLTELADATYGTLPWLSKSATTK